MRPWLDHFVWLTSGADGTLFFMKIAGGFTLGKAITRTLLWWYYRRFED